jgi:hypothetical protein
VAASRHPHESRKRLFPGGTLDPPFAAGQSEGFGRSIDVVGDADQDGVQDLVVGCETLNSLLPSGARILDSGRTRVVSGQTGQVIWTTVGAARAAPPANIGGTFGSSGGDVDGDGVSYIVRSTRTVEVLWRVVLRDPQDPLYHVQLWGLLPDIDGDGYDDFYGITEGVGPIVFLAGGPVSIDRAACPGSTNGLGQTAVLDWQGPLAVGRTYQDIAVTGGIPGALLLLFAAETAGGLPGALTPLCIASPAQRLGAPQTFDLAGHATQRLDWNAPWSLVFQPWIDLDVQAIYRDPFGPTGLAVTNALRVHLSP